MSGSYCSWIQSTEDKAKKKPRSKNETSFEINLATACSYAKCMYIKIPDPVYTRKRIKDRSNGIDIPEKKRPFDGILSVPEDETHHGGNFAIEAKYGSNGLEVHQKAILSTISGINSMAYVIRKRDKKPDEFTVEWPEKNVLYTCGDLKSLIEWFKERTKKS